MKKIAGVDIGNSTTEVCIGGIDDNGKISFLSSSSVSTTGTKGTEENIYGIKSALEKAMGKLGEKISELTMIAINEAAPVIGDTAMETLTETIITDSSMIGHNPSTPAGVGQAVGEILKLGEELPVKKQYDSQNCTQVRENGNPVYENIDKEKSYLVAASERYPYEMVAQVVNQLSKEIRISGIILQADEAVLVENRLDKKIPIVDEVAGIDKLPSGVLAAIEVAPPGENIRMLSNPYGIATLLKLNGEETRQITPIAKSLIGKRSAVVIKTPGGNVKENVLPAGEIYLEAENPCIISLDEGAEKIMQAVDRAGKIYDIKGQENTNIGNMFTKIRAGMDTGEEIHITDILAVDSMAPVKISGALAGETCLEKAVSVAAMVKTRQLPMEKIASKLEEMINVKVEVAGVEAVMAALGSLTTPGVGVPLAVLDMGGGSTDAAYIKEEGQVVTTHQAGAGELVSMLIQTELGLGERKVAENLKKYPLAKVESLFHMRMENGQIIFLEESIDPRFFGRVVMLSEKGMIRLEEEIPMEKIVQVRREAKHKVFVANAMRALKQVAPEGNIKQISHIVLVGGSALDFEIPEMLMEEFSKYQIVCGRGNIRGIEGPRNAVATGLVILSCISKDKW